MLVLGRRVSVGHRKTFGSDDVILAAIEEHYNLNALSQIWRMLV